MVDLFAFVEHEESDLRDKQRAAIEWMLHHPFSGVWADVGEGKTIISLSVVVNLLRQLPRGGFNKVLVIAPIRVCYQTWPADIREWRHTAKLTHCILRVRDTDPAVRARGEEIYRESRQYGMSPAGSIARRKRFEVMQKDKMRRELLEDDSLIHIINREAFMWLVQRRLEMGSWPYDVIFADEASYFGDHKSELFKAAKTVRPYLKRLHLLTATPAAQTYMKYFALTWLLDQGARFGSHVTKFQKKYFDYNHYSRSYKIKPGAREAIDLKTSDLCIIMKKDRKDSEKPIVIRRHVMMTPEQRDAYVAFENSSVLDLPDGTVIEASNAGALRNKLLQAASGAVYDGDRQAHAFHDHKIDELRQLRDELQGLPLLVAYWFKPSLRRLVAAFPDAVVMDKEGKAVTPWNKDKISMLLVHPQSAGHGLNMQYGSGHHLAIFDMFDSLELWIQLVGRLDRNGQRNQVKVHMLVASETEDEVVADNTITLGQNLDATFTRLRLIQKRAKGIALDAVEQAQWAKLHHNASLLDNPFF